MANVATPLAFVLVVSVPPKAAVPPCTPIVTEAFATEFEPASKTLTVTAGLITEPAGVLEGC